MIGKNIRGIRHLWRLSDTSLRKILVGCDMHGYDICEVIKSDKSNPIIGESMFIFNNFYHHFNYDYTTIVSSDEHLKEELKNVEHNRILEIRKPSPNYSFLNGLLFFNEIYLLPEDFDKRYESFIKENSKLFKSIINKYGVNKNDTKIKILYIITNGSKNFFQWAVNLYYGCSVSIRNIKNILLWNDCYKQLVKNLSKGTITAYNSKDLIASLFSELSALRNEKRINDAINSFNTTQKKVLRAAELSPTDKQILSKFSKLSLVKRLNFIKKMSTIDDFKEIMRQMRFVTSTHFDWNKESFMDFLKNVEGIQYEKVFENDNIVLVKVIDYETIKQLGKTTNWCISKNKTYWNNYIEQKNGRATQYMIFDFSKMEDDKLSIVGFTTTYNKGITAAHDFVNNNLMDDDECTFNTLKSYLARFDKVTNIYDVITNCGIDANIMIEYDRPQYKWDKESIMNYLYECVNAENVDIIKSSDEKIALSVRDSNIRYFFGDSYIENICKEYWDCQHILFIDLKSSIYNPNKIQFAIIEDGCEEDYCIGIYNESSIQIRVDFDSKLVEFGLPYNIVRRPKNTSKRLVNAFSSYNISFLEAYMKQNPNKFNKAIRSRISSEDLYYVFRKTLEMLSFDYLNLIYNNGYVLSDFMEGVYVGEIFNSVINNLLYYGRQLYTTKALKIIDKKDIELFYDEKIRDRRLVMYIGSYLILKMMIEKEEGKSVDYKTIYGKVNSLIYSSHFSGDMIKHILYMTLGRISLEKENDGLIFFLKYCIRYGDEEMKETARLLSEKSIIAKKYYDKENAMMGQVKETPAISSFFRDIYGSVEAINTIPIATDAIERY